MSGTPSPVHINFPVELEPIYDMYGAMLYGIAIEISPSEEEADMVFIDTFVKIHHQICIEPTLSFTVVQLIKLVIHTTDQHQAKAHHKANLKLKHPEQIPLIHQLLFQEQNLPDICNQTKLTKTQAGKKIRQEFMRLRNMKTGNSLMWIALY